MNCILDLHLAQPRQRRGGKRIGMAIEYFQIGERDDDLVQQLLKNEEDLYSEAGLAAFDLIAFLGHGHVYVAVEYDEVLGSAYFMRDFDHVKHAYLYSVNIVNAQANPDLAFNLLTVALGDLKEGGIGVVEVNVDPTNYRALTLYRERLGFVASDSFQQDYLGDQELLVLQKEL